MKYNLTPYFSRYIFNASGINICYNSNDYKEVIQMEDKAFELISKMYGEMQQGFKKVNEKFGEFENRFDKIDTRFDKVDARLDKVDSRLDKLELGQETIVKKLDTLAEIQKAHTEQNERQFRELEDKNSGRFTIIEASLKRVSGDVKEIKESIEVLKDMTGRHEVDINILRRRSV
jgi:uncharacterized phage infection (PIP) family protein YhgE